MKVGSHTTAVIKLIRGKAMIKRCGFASTMQLLLQEHVLNVSLKVIITKLWSAYNEYY